MNTRKKKCFQYLHKLKNNFEKAVKYLKQNKVLVQVILIISIDYMELNSPNSSVLVFFKWAQEILLAL
ncbi:hypothetical protein N779_26805 [Vibrio coralliilyticus OCN008]|nr:hypothetical protein N779_26805 [Vibrio coralliilyticus OCN008]